MVTHNPNLLPIRLTDDTDEPGKPGHPSESPGNGMKERVVLPNRLIRHETSDELPEVYHREYQE